MNFESSLKTILEDDQILINEEMKKHTSFRIGGKADYFLKIKTIDQLKNVLNLCEKFNIKTVIIGNGTNLLVTDKGIRGVVIKLEFNNIDVDNDIITVGAGVSIAKLARVALENELEGFEFACGIPGTVGGAIRMNAGAYGGEMKDVVISSKYMDYNGNIKEFNLEQHNFSYRNSIFESNEYIVLETKIQLKKGNKDIIKEKMDENNKSRIQKQPLEFPNAGSTFKRKEGFITAKLIDECGLKGYSVGDAQVSEKHAGFLINKGNATFEDMYNLITKVKKEIKNKFNVDIELEVLILGEI